MATRGKKDLTAFSYNPETDELDPIMSDEEDDVLDVSSPLNTEEPEQDSSDDCQREESVSATKVKRNQDKTSISDRKAIYVSVNNALKQYNAAQQKAFDALMGSMNSIIMTTNRVVTPVKTVKKTVQVAHNIQDIAPCFVSAYLTTYDKPTITPRDLNNTLITHVFDNDDDSFRKTEGVFKNLSLTPTEIKILNKIVDPNSPLNITKADNKILLAKITKPVHEFTHKDITYSIDETLWDKLIENKHISNAVDDKGNILNLCPVELGDSLKLAFKRMPSFAGKFMTKDIFNNYITSVTKKVTDLFYAIPESNKQILIYLGVEYVEHKKILYTKIALLKNAFQEKIDPVTKKFTLESIQAFSSIYPGLDMNKAKVDDLVNRCSYAIDK